MVGVHDGDTLTGITASNEKVKVRLDTIDAPEIKQLYGEAAKKALSDMVFGKEAGSPGPMTPSGPVPRSRVAVGSWPCSTCHSCSPP